MPFDLDRLGNLLLVYGINFLGALIVALIGWWIAGRIERITQRALMSATYMDPTVGTFLSSLAYYAVLVVTLCVILQVVGIQATSIVAILGVASLAIGLALQGILSNVAAEIMLLAFRPLRLGDSIEVAGKSGTVKNLNMFMTELASDDNVQVQGYLHDLQRGLYSLTLSWDGSEAKWTCTAQTRSGKLWDPGPNCP